MTIPVDPTLIMSDRDASSGPSTKRDAPLDTGERSGPLPEPSVALWVTMCGLVLVLAASVVASVQVSGAAQTAGIVLAAFVALMGIVYWASVASIRRLVNQLEARFPGSVVFPVATTAGLRSDVALLAAVNGAKLGQYAGVTADRAGISIWKTARSEQPLNVLLWDEIATVETNSVLVSLVPVTSLTLSGHQHGFPFRLPLPVYSATTGYPGSRRQFASVSTRLHELRASAAADGRAGDARLTPAEVRRKKPRVVGALVVTVLVGVVGWFGGQYIFEYADDARVALFDTPEAAEAVAWVSDDGLSSVTFPGTPATTTQEEVVFGQPVLLTVTVWEREDVALAVQSSPVAPLLPTGVELSALTAADIDSLLKSSLDGAVANVKDGTLVTESYADLDGARTLRGTISSAAPGTMDVIIAFHAGSLHIALAGGEDNRSEMKSAFLASFHLS
ncbi:hypothetical protein [Cryobacterium melibiosiphilum]|nr:hypothetical protein [Cryobacterium melibiosiphilum]